MSTQMTVKEIISYADKGYSIRLVGNEPTDSDRKEIAALISALEAENKNND